MAVDPVKALNDKVTTLTASVTALHDKLDAAADTKLDTLKASPWTFVLVPAGIFGVLVIGFIVGWIAHG